MRLLLEVAEPESKRVRRLRIRGLNLYDYEKVLKYWNGVFSSEDAPPVSSPSMGNDALDKALDWLCKGAETVLDFGCGSGACLYKCCLRGTRGHVGIDLSDEAIKAARERLAGGPEGEFDFMVGGVSALESIPAKSADALLLFNIVDNLIPEDSIKLLENVSRIAANGAKALIKLNPFITKEQMELWGVKVLEGDLLDDGLYLWNQSTEDWKRLFKNYFIIDGYEDIYYPEHDQYNRLFRLTAC